MGFNLFGDAHLFCASYCTLYLKILKYANASWADASHIQQPRLVNNPGKLLTVIIKSFSAFAAKVSRIHHLSQQRAGSVLRVPEALVQHLHDVEANV